MIAPAGRQTAQGAGEVAVGFRAVEMHAHVPKIGTTIGHWLLEGLFIVISVGLGFWITGIPSPVVFGALTAVASFVPLVGTALVWVPASIYLWTQGVLWKTLFLVIWSLVIVGTADNFLRPLLVSGKSQVGTLTVFFGGLGGLAAFGFVGLFVGPVILALVLALLEFADEGGAAPAS